MPLYIVLGHQRACMPVYIGKGGDWSGVTAASLTDRQTTEYSATQLVYSIKFMLSHAKSHLNYYTYNIKLELCAKRIWSVRELF